jgi:hypothetical protein
MHLSGRAHPLALLVFLLSSQALLAQDGKSPADTDAEGDRVFSDYALQAAASYESLAGPNGERKLSLFNKPVLRWSNPLVTNEVSGEVFLWTDDGRPAAVLSLYRYTKDGERHESHEFLSLSQEPLAFDGAAVWSPQDAGVVFQAFADEASPADAAWQRLRQMRALAAQFSMDMTSREGITRSLRLLPQPLYRYDAKEASVIDGALFTFVEGTDPEAFVLIEAFEDGKATKWRYALGRMNSVELKAKRKNKPAWEAPLLPWKDVVNRRDKTYASFKIR